MPAPIPTRAGRLFADGLVVMTYVEGGPPETQADWRRVAGTLRELHRLTQGWPQRPGWRSSTDLLHAETGTKIDLGAMPPESVVRCRAAWARLTGRQTCVVHGDLNPGNVRMTAHQVALIDWDESHADVPDLDLMLPDNAAVQLRHVLAHPVVADDEVSLTADVIMRVEDARDVTVPTVVWSLPVVSVFSTNLRLVERCLACLHRPERHRACPDQCADPAERHGGTARHERPVNRMIVIDSASPVPPFEQLRAQLARQIQDRTLAVGTRLPTIRRLAAQTHAPTACVDGAGPRARSRRCTRR